MHAHDCCLRRRPLVRIVFSTKADTQDLQSSLQVLVGGDTYFAHFPDEDSPLLYCAMCSHPLVPIPLPDAAESAKTEEQADEWMEIMCDVWHVLEETRRCGTEAACWQAAGGNNTAQEDGVENKKPSGRGGRSMWGGHDGERTLPSCEMLASLLHVVRSATLSLADLAAAHQKREGWEAGEAVPAGLGGRQGAREEARILRPEAREFVRRSMVLSSQIWEAALYAKDVMHSKRGAWGRHRRFGDGDARGRALLAGAHQAAGWRKGGGSLGRGKQARCNDGAAASAPALPPSPRQVLRHTLGALTTPRADSSPAVAGAAAPRAANSDAARAASAAPGNYTRDCPDPVPRPLSHPTPASPPTAAATVGTTVSPRPHIAALPGHYPIPHSHPHPAPFTHPAFAIDVAEHTATQTATPLHPVRPPIILASPLTHAPPHIPGYKAAVYSPAPASRDVHAPTYTLSQAPSETGAPPSAAVSPLPAGALPPYAVTPQPTFFQAPRFPTTYTFAAQPRLATTGPRLDWLPSDVERGAIGMEKFDATAQSAGAATPLAASTYSSPPLSPAPSSMSKRQHCRSACRCGSEILHFRCCCPFPYLLPLPWSGVPGKEPGRLPAPACVRAQVTQAAAFKAASKRG